VRTETAWKNVRPQSIKENEPMAESKDTPQVSEKPLRRVAKRRWKSWGEVYNAALRSGYDHGYAAWKADQYEKKYLKETTNV
jgi:hypothetical protein